MSLQLFFDPLDTPLVQELLSGSLGFSAHVQLNHKTFPNIEEADLAIFSLAENRGAGHQSNGEQQELDPVRKALYHLANFSTKAKVVDLGHLRPGDSLTDSRERLSEVSNWLMEHNTLPIILGGSHDLTYGQYLAYASTKKIISVLNIDAKLDLADQEALPCQRHLHQLFMHQPNYLFEYGQLGHQRFLSPKKPLETLQKLNFEMRSVGQIRDSLLEIEPLIRTADMLSFDLCALKGGTELAGKPSPFGLTPEEAAQICWYAGNNDKLSSIGFYGYWAEKDMAGQTANSLAVMLWYFIEGFCHRKHEYSFKSNFHIKYIVALYAEQENHASQAGPTELVFYKSKVSDRWWMEISSGNDTDLTFNRNAIVPCSYQDYETATKGQIPNRWIKAMERL